MPNRVRKIISGGQTGADRAALDFAIKHGIEIGGYVPKDRAAEDGRISDCYPNLIETDCDEPAERTRLNVIHSDGTLILSHGRLSGGSKFTREIAQKLGKPHLEIDFDRLTLDDALESTRKWLDAIECEELNIAGPRSSEDPMIYKATLGFLNKLSSGS